MQLKIFGTLSVLFRSKHAGLVPSVAPLIHQLRAGGQRFGRAVVAQVLLASGEAPE